MVTGCGLVWLERCGGDRWGGVGSAGELGTGVLILRLVGCGEMEV